MQVALLGANTPSWLVRPQDVVSHLFFVATEINDIMVEIAGNLVEGTMSFPSVERGSFTVFLSVEPSVLPTPGSVVLVRYTRGEAAYSFLTSVSEVLEMRRWRLQFPSAIERDERRLARRRSVGGGFRVRLHFEGSSSPDLPLYDLSASGLGLHFNPLVVQLQPGQQLLGTVCLPDGDCVDVTLEISNVRALTGPGASHIAGCRFVSLAPEDHARLAQAAAGTGPRRA